MEEILSHGLSYEDLLLWRGFLLSYGRQLKDWLKRRGWSIPNRYYLCKEVEETSDYLFLFCGKARMLWNNIFTALGVQWVLHSSANSNLLGWNDSFGGKRRKVLGTAPLCLMRSL